jgi:DNA-binding transcriptional ArsR family regulator
VSTYDSALHGAVLDALGDPTRRSVVELIADRPLAVGDIARHLPVSRPAVSQHLRVLKDAGLVVDERDGTRRLYRIDPTGVEPLRAYLDRLWTDALDRFTAAAERAHAERAHADRTDAAPTATEHIDREQP